MVFSSSAFLFLFLPAVILGYYLLERIGRKLTNLYLFLVSILFYCWNGMQHVGVLLFSVVINYLLALLLQSTARRAVRRLLLVLAVAADAGLLCYFKYSGFFLTNLSLVTGIPIAFRELALPIGISFYTFQSMSYVIDVYRGEDAVRNPIDLGMYIVFFPQLIAGPIVRYGQVKEYLHDRRIGRDAFFDGASRFLVGLIRKVVMANSLGELADVVFNGGDIQSRSVLMLWLAAIAYTLQLYYDFSGYSDMAIGLGRMFGFQFPENFDYPYASASVTEFWRRWHMTLSAWFRDYVYIPLGGSRRGVYRHIRNLFLVWVLTGLWHGAAWRFLLWGLAYFLILTAEKYLIRPWRFRTGIGRAAYRVLSLLLVCLLWVVFRADSLAFGSSFIAAMFGFGGNAAIDRAGLFHLREYWFYLAAGILFAFPVLPALRRKRPTLCSGLYAALLLTGTLLSVAFILKNAYNPFIYFQF